MTDQWVPAPPQPPPPDPPPGLPPANTWAAAEPCAAPDSPSIVGSIIITDVPATIVAPYAWGITLNDGGSPPNFSIDHFDNAGALIESPIAIEGSSGDVMLTHDPTQPLGAATKDYVDSTGLREAPIDNTTYGRDNGAWVPLPASYMPEAPNTSTRFGRFNSTWQPDAIQTDAPSDGAAYARQNGAWTAAVTGGPYMPISGGTFTGPVVFPSNNSVVIDGAINTQHAILGRVASIMRWQLLMPDMTSEGVGNAGANFSLTAFSTTGSQLGTWFSIARADGATTFGGSGVTIAGGLAVNGVLALAGPGNFAMYGGTNGQVLATNGSGVLSWATRLSDAPSDGQFYTRQNAAWAIAPGGMTDAPSDGTAYARKSAAWAHLSHTDITDWTASLAPYALTASVPIASTTTPAMNGTAAVGAGTTWARADHVHPSDTSRLAIGGGTMTGALTLAANPAAPLQPATKQYVDALPAAMNDNRIINGNFAINQRGYASGVALAATVYGHDRWKAGASGCTYTFTASLPDTTITITAGSLTQIIEAGVIEGGVYTLSWTGTAQARVYQGAPTGSYAASPIVTASLAAGTNTIVEFNAGTLTRVKLESGGAATPFNRYSMTKSLADCQRYCQRIDTLIGGYSPIASGILWSPLVFMTQMRAAPTAAILGAPGYTNSSGLGFGSLSVSGCYATCIVTTVNNGTCGFAVLLSAEL